MERVEFGAGENDAGDANSSGSEHWTVLKQRKRVTR